jgi:uncharacterized SAM-dependent methyltransferase
MYLQSLVNQSVIISKANLSFKLKHGELILTEHSHKYTIPQIQELMKITGFEIKQKWLDVNQHYSLILAYKK